MVEAKRRFAEQNKIGKPLVLRPDHPSAVEGRTLFPTRVSDPEGKLLKSGHNQRKIGSHVSKGKWSGMPIFTLTLEERATCPRTCSHWLDCYGNHMHFPKRHRHGQQLVSMLKAELKYLNAIHPGGFVVRLHILGDFYSIQYVRFWHWCMHKFKCLHVFGYTARTMEEKIGEGLRDVRQGFPDRWWVRWSDRDDKTLLSTGESGIVCPAQTGKTDCCGTCGLCWTAQKPIRFLLH